MTLNVRWWLIFVATIVIGWTVFCLTYATVHGQLLPPTVDTYAVHEAIVVRVVDGDTLETDVLLEFGVSVTLMIRVHDYNAAELNTPEGRAQREALQHILTTVDHHVLVRSYRGQRTFARWVCDVWIGGRPFADVVRGTP